MIVSNRYIYVAGHTTEDVKDALKAEARKQNRSMSHVLHEILREGLKAKGHLVHGLEYKIERD